MVNPSPDLSKPRIGLIFPGLRAGAEAGPGGADPGGETAYVLGLANSLANLGYAIDLWTCASGGLPPAREPAPGVRVLRVPRRGPEAVDREDPHRGLAGWPEDILERIQAEGLSYRALNSHGWEAGVAARPVAEALGLLHIHTPHSLGLERRAIMEGDHPGSAAELEEHGHFSERIREETRVSHAADAVIATSPDQARALRESYEVPAANIHTMPPGYDDTRFHPVSAATRRSIRRRLGRSGPTVFALGRLDSDKSYDLLIRSFAVVSRRMPPCTLLLAAETASLDERQRGRLAELKELAASLGLEKRIQFGMRVADADLPDAYRSADVFVLSSRHEPFGLSAVEAMACGTPTVVTTQGGLHKALTFGRHALYADFLDPDDLAVCILHILRHPRVSRRLSVMGAQRVRNVFAWPRVAQKFADLVTEGAAATAAAHYAPGPEG